MSTLLLGPSVGAVEPLSPAESKIFQGSATDPKPRRLKNMSVGTQGKHFLAGNEGHLEVFYPHLKNLGGGYVGVGSDQAYIFIGWMRPRFAWLIDYDVWVLSLHRAYREFFLSAETPEAFLRFFRPRQQKATVAFLRKRGVGKRAVRAYELARYKIHFRFKRLRKVFRAAKVPTFLTDTAQYRFVRAMIRAGRTRPMLANLLAKRGIQGIGDAARALKVPIRALYISNAEQYWSFGRQYRKNIKSLPYDEKSWLIRTIATGRRNSDYHYVLQVASNYVAWLQKRWVRRWWQIVPRVPMKRGVYPLTIIDRPPKKRKKKRKRTARRRK